MLYAKNTFNLKDFVLEIDISIHNKKHTAFARGSLKIFLLKDNPMK
jgi:hypothetical protein